MTVEIILMKTNASISKSTFKYLNIIQLFL